MDEEQKTETTEVKEEKQEELLFSESEYRRFEQRRLEYSNALIGSFDNKGDYKITPEILKEFVEMPKVVREIRDNRYYAIANSNLGSSFNVKFSVVVGDVDEEKKFATLCLLEDVVNPNTGTYSLKSTPVATYKDDNDGYFGLKMKKVYNLQIVEEQIDGGLYDANKFPNFFAAKSKKIKLKGQLDSFGEELDENYVVEMLKELKKMGPYGEWVMKNVARQRSLLGDKFPKKGAKGYFKAYARLLDQAIMNAKGFPMTPEQIATINRIQQKRIDNLKTATTEVVLAGSKPKAKSASKSSGGGGKSSGGKKKGGKAGGGKKEKKENKKDDKKKVPIYKQKFKVTTKPKDNVNKNESNPAEHKELNEILEEFDVIGEDAQVDVIKNQFNSSIKFSIEDELSDSFKGRSFGEMKSAVFDKFRPQRHSSKERDGLER